MEKDDLAEKQLVENLVQTLVSHDFSIPLAYRAVDKALAIQEEVRDLLEKRFTELTPKDGAEAQEGLIVVGLVGSLIREFSERAELGIILARLTKNEKG